MTGLECIPALRALGEENRLRIFRLLLSERLNVSEVSQRLQVSEYNISKHLRIMKEAGLLEIEKQGQQRFYRVAEEFKAQSKQSKTVDLGCCLFRVNELPK